MNLSQFEAWLADIDHRIAGVEVTASNLNKRRNRVDLPADKLVLFLEAVKGEASFVHLSAISCVDWIDDGEFELVYHLWSYELNQLISAHIRVSRDPGEYQSIYDLYRPAGFFERDIHEMYGLYFHGAPDMEKFILTEWNGIPPMRKEFDSEEFVEQNFSWQEYNPEWLKELVAEGGGVVIPCEEQRFSRSVATDHGIDQQHSNWSGCDVSSKLCRIDSKYRGGD
ncbi:MAG: NADH-quinone oxidoreductase subunit C [Thiotrichales bacterium]|jgi:NADH-quinone oxidoreductase subunit C|nr:NADH-quinone oxidoreductase subunit C [Thiotrichales bacterium]MBT3753351.1 NADH-quinone oxidoreductase subunit C [Thiotrichales bacterium]MBT3837093.1 NADH-quinone oxidoreductase subunit C [Thiotrichales bacterium]MBT4151943.1 NADH-quinone oxidoreductase subunit C [Thiotrichales bacterium]MBT4260938.1 NADH-quinone oxidoreductase subunit C [Thiotrichales bacterium]